MPGWPLAGETLSHKEHDAANARTVDLRKVQWGVSDICGEQYLTAEGSTATESGLLDLGYVSLELASGSSSGSSRFQILQEGPLFKRSAALCFIVVHALIACSPAGSPPAANGDSPATASAEPAGEIILATATSTQDSGLLDVLLPVFQDQTGYRVKIIAVGTGEALAMGSRGDADVVLAHAPSLEMASIESRFTINRRLIMHNDFLVIGPTQDPAGVSGLSDAAAGMKRIADSGASFASRGDNSGTHLREQSLWKAASVEPGGDWYIELGQGMGATLMVANERQAYALTDRGTYLAFEERIDLEPMVMGGPMMLNLYSVMEVNPEQFENINNDGARALGDFLLSAEAQGLIATYGVDKFGEPLFFPDGGRVDSDLTGK